MAIQQQTAMDIALAYREIENATKLLADIEEALNKHESPDIRDVFGRPQGGLQLGVPSGHASHLLFDVPWWALAKPVIEAHIASKQAVLLALNERARHELGLPNRNRPRLALDKGESLDEEDFPAVIA